MPLIHLHSQLSDKDTPGVNNYVGSLFISFPTEADLYIGPFLASWRWNAPLVPCDFTKLQLFLVTNVNWWCPSRAFVRGWMALSWKRFLLLYTDQVLATNNPSLPCSCDFACLDQHEVLLGVRAAVAKKASYQGRVASWEAASSKLT